jgi:ammonia channel protein AmtB
MDAMVQDRAAEMAARADEQAQRRRGRLRWSLMIGGVLVAVIGGLVVYGALKFAVGLRLDPEEEFNGADLTIHKINATPDRDVSW